MTVGPESPPANPALIERLRARIRRMEGAVCAGNDGQPPAGAAALGDPAVDRHLPWGGLRRACLHALGGDDGAVTGFAAGLLARLGGVGDGPGGGPGGGSVLWCRRDGDLYGPGLAAFGLDSARLIVVRARRPEERLWAMEEALRSGAPAAVLGEVDRVDPTAARRLQLAAEAGGVTALLLNGNKAGGPPLPATTRWQVTAAASGTDGASDGTADGTTDGTTDGGPLFTRPRWRADLQHCRGGRPAAWIMEWRDEPTGGFAVVTDLRDRSPAPPQAGGDAPRDDGVVSLRRAV